MSSDLSAEITAIATAVATVSASLGAVWIKGHYDDRTQNRQAAEARLAAHDDRRQQAYADLVMTARLALRNFRQLRVAYTAKAPDIPEVEEIFKQTDSLATDMYKTAALAELIGSPGGRKHARAIHDKAKACADFFQKHELALVAASRQTGGKLPVSSLTSFDTQTAQTLCDELSAAIDQIIEAVNAELGP